MVSRALWWSRRKRPWQWPTEQSTRTSSCSQASGMLFMTATLDRLCVSCMSTLARARVHMMFHVRNGRGKCANTSNVRSCVDLSISQGYMVPQQPGNVARDLNRRVAAMFQSVLHDIPISSISIPLLINKGPRQGHGQLNPCASARFPA